MLPASNLGSDLNLKLHVLIHKRRLNHHRRRLDTAKPLLQDAPSLGEIITVWHNVVDTDDIRHTRAGFLESFVHVAQDLLGLLRDVGRYLARVIVVPIDATSAAFLSRHLHSKYNEVKDDALSHTQLFRIP